MCLPLNIYGTGSKTIFLRIRPVASFTMTGVLITCFDPIIPQVIGVLDWEMATLGDPLMDLGFSFWPIGLKIRIIKFLRATRRQPTHLKGMFSRKQVVDYYFRKNGRACTQKIGPFMKCSVFSV